jgi:hypothetical protein
MRRNIATVWVGAALLSVYEPLPTLNASVILQPQYFQGTNYLKIFGIELISSSCAPDTASPLSRFGSSFSF